MTIPDYGSCFAATANRPPRFCERFALPTEIHRYFFPDRRPALIKGRIVPQQASSTHRRTSYELPKLRLEIDWLMRRAESWS